MSTARDGTGHFLGQRVSAVVLALLGMWFVVVMATLPEFSYTTVIAFIGKPLNTVLLLVLSVTIAYHSYLGVQVVIDDYVHATGLRLASLYVSQTAHAVLAVAAVYSLLKIGLRP
ncbi:MAG: succinate dehydrogenase, hydrophobic membrane anchor protein [Proteobacteria bacterium]|nr:succinate dehydrogenase, hydrophobic membrane anchor protein [Pseudomonadota bacterium]